MSHFAFPSHHSTSSSWIPSLEWTERPAEEESHGQVLQLMFEMNMDTTSKHPSEVNNRSVYLVVR
jgi:hypothetical protein